MRYVYNRADGTDTAADLPGLLRTQHQRRFHLANISEVHTFSPNLSNAVPARLQPLLQPDAGSGSQLPGPCRYSPNLVFGDLNNVNLGPDPNAPQATIQNFYQAVDTLTWVKGHHTINVGMEGRKYISPQVFVQRLRGDYEYKNLDHVP